MSVMEIKTKAYMVHLLTATGAVFAMLALLEAVNENWAMMFVWLMVAFAVDGKTVTATYSFLDLMEGKAKVDGEIKFKKN